MFPSWSRLPAGRRRAALLAATVFTAVAASGCSSFVAPPTASQSNVIADAVSVSSEICVDGFGANPPSFDFSADCSPSGPLASATPTGTTTYYAGNQGQLLIGYLVPDGTGAPQELASADLPGITFSQSTDYASALAAYAAPPSGYQWVGYMSSEITLNQSLDVHLTATFVPPASSPVPFTVEQVELGDRADGTFNGATQTIDGTALDASRPLNCTTESALTSDGANEAPTGCEDDSSTSTSNSALTVASLRTLTVSAPASAINAQAGTTATVPFTVEAGGTFDPASPFTVSATTDAGGVKPVAAESSLVPSGTQTETLTVPLPSTLPGGTYMVTLSLAAPGSVCGDMSQCTRTASATLDVTAVPTVTAPTVTRALTTRDVLRFEARKLMLTLELGRAESKRLVLERRHDGRWITLRTIRKRVGAGLHSLSVRKLFHERLHRHDRYRLLVATVGASAASGRRTFTFSVH